MRGLKVSPVVFFFPQLLILLRQGSFGTQRETVSQVDGHSTRQSGNFIEILAVPERDPGERRLFVWLATSNGRLVT